jgi:hypothetical protein
LNLKREQSSSNLKGCFLKLKSYFRDDQFFNILNFQAHLKINDSAGKEINENCIETSNPDPSSFEDEQAVPKLERKSKISGKIMLGIFPLKILHSHNSRTALLNLQLLLSTLSH